MPRRSKMRDQIMEAAIELFNEKGYRNVSLREIADAAGTAIGNLTYHFPRKEDLLAEIQDRFHTESSDIFIDPITPEEILPCLLRSFKNAELRFNSSPFYYQHILGLSVECSEVFEQNEGFREKLFNYYLDLFMRAVASGYMRAEIPQELYSHLAYMLVLSLTVWVHEGSPYYDKHLPKIEVSEGLFSALYPYLTETGIKQYWSLIESI